MGKSGVYIIGCSDIGEKVCAASGRISTKNGTALEIIDASQDAEKNSNLISKVTSSGHTSTIEHIFFNLAFENVSVVVEQFMIEFRLASFTVKSRRYVDFSNSGYYIPDSLKDEDKAVYEAHMNKMFALYARLCENGVAKEDARFVLPYCFYSNFYCSLGGRELVNVIRAMIFGRGKKIREIYTIGLELLEECKKIAPGVFSSFESQYGKCNDEIDLEFAKCESSENAQCAVEVLSFTADADKLIAASALIENAGISTEKAYEMTDDPERRKMIIEKVLASSRPRVLENAVCTVRYNNVSLSTLTHFARHRMQSLNIPSIADCDRSRYIIPKSVSNDENLLAAYIDAFESTKELFDDFTEKGYTSSETVYCLLSGNTLDIISTMNARELLLFFRLRSCNRAQWEIRELATELLRQLRRLSPDLFGHYGPSCYCNGVCPEGRLTCGKASQVKDFFASL